MKPDPGRFPGSEIQVCETFVRVRFHEVDALGHVNNAAYLNYLEQAAIDHAALLGLDLERLRSLGGVFVARRHEVFFRLPAHAGDVLRIVTWLEPPRGARVVRRYSVFRDAEQPREVSLGGRLLDAEAIDREGEWVVQAATEWVFASERGQPRRIPSEVGAVFQLGDRPGGDEAGPRQGD